MGPIYELPHLFAISSRNQTNMDRNHDDRRAIVPPNSTVTSRQHLLRRKPGSQRPPAPVQEETVVTQCSRCDKEFVQKKAPDQKSARGKVGRVPRLYKLCEHCREKGKGRSRRWQMKTKEHGGLCRRCGEELSGADGQFVLCVKCRKAFRDRKLSRATQGKCIQCCEPMDADSTPVTAETTDELDTPKPKVVPQSSEKVVRRRCQKCRGSRTVPTTKPFSSDFIQSMYK